LDIDYMEGFDVLLGTRNIFHPKRMVAELARWL
jgi:hypothetical protein